MTTTTVWRRYFKNKYISCVHYVMIIIAIIMYDDRLPLPFYLTEAISHITLLRKLTIVKYVNAYYVVEYLGEIK